MKNIKVLVCLIVFISTKINAQDTNERIIKADTTKVLFENKDRPCLKYEVDVDFKSLDKDWSNLLSKSYDAKVKEIDDKYLVTKDVVVNSISDLRMDLLVVVRSQGTKTIVNFSGAFGYDIYLDSDVYPKEFGALKDLVEKFLYDSSSIYYHNVLANLSGEIGKLSKKNQNLAKDNAKLNSKITESEVSIESLKKTEEGGSVSTKNMKKITKETKKIVGYEADIAGNKKDIAANEAIIDLKNDKKDYYTARQKILNSNH